MIRTYRLCEEQHLLDIRGIADCVSVCPAHDLEFVIDLHHEHQ